MKLFTVKSIVLVMSLATLSVASMGVVADDVEDAIEYRQGAFTLIKHHFGPMAAMMKGKMDFDADLFKENAEAVATLSQFPIHGFIEGSYDGDTDAMPEIAENKDDFREKMETFQIEATNLAKAAQDATDLDSLKAPFGKVGQSCKACHQDYRKD